MKLTQSKKGTGRQLKVTSDRHPRFVKDWEVVADNLSRAGFSWGCVSALIPTGEQSGLQTRFATTEARFVVRADEKRGAFLELESTIRVETKPSERQ